MQRVVLRHATAEDPDRQTLRSVLARPVLHGSHAVDVVVDVDLEFELVAEQPLQLHGVEENRSVLHRAHEDRDPVLVANRQQRRLLHAERALHRPYVAAEQRVELRRRHLALVVATLHQRAEEAVGIEECLLPEPQVVDADHAREAELQIPRIGIHLPNRMTDDAVCIVVQIRARRGETRHDAALDQRDQAALVQASGRHRAR